MVECLPERLHDIAIKEGFRGQRKIKNLQKRWSDQISHDINRIFVHVTYRNVFPSHVLLGV